MEERSLRGMAQARASEGNTQVGAWPSTGETSSGGEWVGASFPPSPTLTSRRQPQPPHPHPCHPTKATQH